MKNKYGFPNAALQDYVVDREEETKTMCPACRGSGKQEIRERGPSMYSYVLCANCGGEGMVLASEAAKIRKRISGTYKKETS